MPPPPEPDGELIASFGVPFKPISGVPDLMHHKYVVRDGEHVWTGSMNWTDDSFSRQENVVVRIRSEGRTGLRRGLRAALGDGGGRAERVRGAAHARRRGDGRAVWFTPGNSEDLSARIARAIFRAKRRIRIASPVITTGPVLGALAQVSSEKRVDLAGVVDQTQMRGVVYQWGRTATSRGSSRSCGAGSPRIHRQAVAGLAARGRPARLHAREGDDRRRHRVRRELQPLALRRDERRERPRDREPELAERLAEFVDETRVLYPPVELESTG